MTETYAPSDLEEIRRRFPTKFTRSILDQIELELRSRMLHQATILDPFGGVGGIHALADRLPVTTYAVDIEPEQAACHDRTVHGDSRLLPKVIARYGLPTPDVIVTSPAYGNRLSDQYLGSDGEKCRPCDGKGWKTLPDDRTEDCAVCQGSGKSKSRRQGYAIALGRKVSEASGARWYWGKKYRDLHAAVLDAMAQVGAAWWMVNVSSSIATLVSGGKPEYLPVMEWWVEEIARRYDIVGLRAIETPRMRMGQNGDQRVPVEHLIIARRRG